MQFCLIFRSVYVLYRMRNLLEELTKWGLKDNMNKPEYLYIETSDTDLIIPDQTIKSIRKYKYLVSLYKMARKNNHTAIKWFIVDHETQNLIYNSIVDILVYMQFQRLA